MRLIVAVLLVSVLACTANAEAKLGFGDVPPDSLGVNNDDREVKVSDFRGKVVVVSFWATWCTYCLKELPILENMQRTLGPERIAVVIVNTDKESDKYRTMRRKMKNFELTMTVDSFEQDVAKPYEVKGLPHMLIIDRQGKISSVHVGYSEEMLPRIVDEINELLEE